MYSILFHSSFSIKRSVAHVEMRETGLRGPWTRPSNKVTSDATTRPAVTAHKRGPCPAAHVTSGATHLRILLDLRLIDRAVGVSVGLRERR